MVTRCVRHISLIILCSLIFLTCVPVRVFAAQGDPQIVKVGFCEIKGFFQYDGSGKHVGYGVDVLEAIEKESNLRFQYVDVKDWEDLTEMLQKGEIDVMMPVSDSKMNDSQFSYSSENIIYTYRAVMTTNNREDLYYGDAEGLGNMSIATTKATINNTETKTYFTDLGISPDFKIYDTVNQCKQAVEDGKADAFISNIMDFESGMKVLARFNSSDNHIISRKESNVMDRINSSLANIKLNSPNFFSDLEEKYYSERNVTPLTKEEAQYVKNAEPLRVAIYADNEPIAYYDEDANTYAGIGVDMLNLLAEKTGLKFQLVPVANEEELEEYLESDKADLIFPGDVSGVADTFATDGLLTSTVAFATIDGVLPDVSSPVKVGVVRRNDSVVQALNSQGDSMKIVTYDNAEECLGAVKTGEVGMIASNPYALGYILQDPHNDSIRSIYYRSLEDNWRLVGKSDETLQSVLNKGIDSISSTEKGEVINRYTVMLSHEESFGNFMYANRMAIAFILFMIIVIIGACCLYVRIKNKFVYRLEKTNEELEKANNAKSRFLSNVSHDMRTPMNAILGMTALALDEKPKNPNVKEYLENINSSSKYLLGLINDVLDMSKIESGELTLNEETLSCNTFRKGISSMIEPLCKEKNIELEFRFDEPQKNILADKIRFQQIFFNLLSNAIKFSDIGSTVEFAIVDTGEDEEFYYKDFIVKDYGSGMSEDFQKNMFSPFTQEKKDMAPNQEGTGLGLSIVKNIVDTMNGSIKVDSHLGEGSTFTVSLPLKKSKELEAQQLSEDDNSKKNLTGKKVLLVEDHPLNQVVAIKILEKQGMIVTLAEDGQKGVDAYLKADSGHFDIILMDIRMPNMDGLEAARMIRNSGKAGCTDIPIVAMTANAYSEDVKVSKDAGMNAHLSKPIEPKLLVETMKGLI